jgi:hypothetical protein
MALLIEYREWARKIAVSNACTLVFIAFMFILTWGLMIALEIYHASK